MGSPFVIPLAVFALVVFIVAITHLAKLHDKEREVAGQLHAAQMEHARKLKELELELERIKQGA